MLIRLTDLLLASMFGGTATLMFSYWHRTDETLYLVLAISNVVFAARYFKRFADEQSN
jgi:hypothetical protein